jgi:hypothetical protein
LSRAFLIASFGASRAIEPALNLLNIERVLAAARALSTSDGSVEICVHRAARCLPGNKGLRVGL